MDETYLAGLEAPELRKVAEALGLPVDGKMTKDALLVRIARNQW